MAAVLMNIELKGVKIPVIFEEDRRLPLIDMELIFRESGSLADPIPGVASMSAKLLNEGTSKDGAVAFARVLDNHAITLHAGAGRETFVLSLEALDSQFPLALEKLAELLRDPNYTQEAFEKVRKQTLGKLMQKRSNFDYIASRGLREILFEGTPAANPQLGSEESVKATTLGNLKSFIGAHLHLDNLIVLIGGNIDRKGIEKALGTIVDSLERGEVPALGHYEASDANRSVVQYEDTDQAYIYFGSPYEMRADDSRRVYGKVAAFILGSGGFGSRMMEEIRVKRGLAYSAYARFSVNRTNSYFSGYLQTKLESADEAVKVVRELVDDFVEKGATAKELEAARKYFLGSEPLRTETMSQRLNRAFNEYYSGIGMGWSSRELEIIKDMKLEELNDFIRKHREILDLSWSIVTKKED
jgi:predicted Zn-dependent peptidase